MQKIIVPEKFNNKKVSDLLFYHFNGLTRNTLYKALRKKDIRVNDIKINADTPVKTGDIITVYITNNLLFNKIKRL